MQQSNTCTKLLLPGMVTIILFNNVAYTWVGISPYILAALLFLNDISAESFSASCASQMQRKSPFIFHSVPSSSIFSIFLSV